MTFSRLTTHSLGINNIRNLVYRMKRIHHTGFAFRLLTVIGLWLMAGGGMWAQEFSVGSFRLLPNDVSAFVNSVRDLNDEACALVKVEAPADFAFSTPLGIVKRKDEVGEIWLYLPKGTKMLTLKHPEWGVLRDYKFGMALESRMTYELKLNLPKDTAVERHDTIVEVRTIVDTITVASTRQKLPLSVYALATIGIHEDGPSYGVFVALMRRHGVFVHASTDFQSIGNTRGNCEKDGSITATGGKPYYTGKVKNSHFTITAGAVHQLAKGICLFEGVGYGRSATAWQLGESEGGGYVLNDGLTHKGVAAEAGALLSFGRIAVSASALTIAGKQWQGSIGVGIRLWRDKNEKK